jgi:hypothetical protein
MKWCVGFCSSVLFCFFNGRNPVEMWPRRANVTVCHLLCSKAWMHKFISLTFIRYGPDILHAGRPAKHAPSDTVRDLRDVTWPGLASIPREPFRLLITFCKYDININKVMWVRK